MTGTVTITRPDVLALLSQATDLTGGSETETLATALRCLLDREHQQQHPERDDGPPEIDELTETHLGLENER